MPSSHNHLQSHQSGEILIDFRVVSMAAFTGFVRISFWSKIRQLTSRIVTFGMLINTEFMSTLFIL